ncbi:putative glycoside hydrolase [Effusibacillus lacus]|uniref:putative glycoside hydrolase n=1 Tax=Effusibacillus lacus TaxID=1348429 RepID=UPI00140436C2|nr:putative glycoside hydrolase [Effusibacillus lacus]
MKKWPSLLLVPLLAACSTTVITSGSSKIESKAESKVDPTASQAVESLDTPAAPAVVEPPKQKLAQSFGFTYPDAVRGIYVTAHSAGGDRMSELLDLVDKTALNAMVIDIKDDWGVITYKMDDPGLQTFSQSIVKDPNALIETLKQHNIYPIARIVVFKDSLYAKAHPELSFVNPNGTVWTNGRGEAFVNPFLQDVWKYNVEIAKKAAELGFQDIQFDYVRFPEGFEKMDSTLKYGMGEYKDRTPTKFTQLQKQHQEALAAFEAKKAELKKQQETAQAKVADLKGKESLTDEQKKELQSAEEALAKATADLQNHEKSAPQAPQFSEKERLVQLRVDAVTDFVSYAKKELEPYGVKVSVDIFGYSATLPETPGIGQNFSRICENVDVISSMIYPSHWGPGYFHIPKPDLEPYRLVDEYAKAESEKLGALKNKVISRPWIQDFTASWLGGGNYKRYGKAEVEAQIQALKANGINEFLLWNAGNSYTNGVDYTP